jgi:response regulator RpfG family c-di-GMP phosphodiesterase
MPPSLTNVGSEPPPWSPPEDAPRKRVVLIVEDDFLTRCTAAMYLRETGYRVIEAENVAEGISVLSSGTRVDFVFSDINMPGPLNGLGFAQWLAREHPTIRILLTSGVHREAVGLAAGALFILKPYDLNEVDGLIKTML